VSVLSIKSISKLDILWLSQNLSNYRELMFEIGFLHTEYTLKTVVKYFPRLCLWYMNKYRVSSYMKQLEWIIFLRAKYFRYPKYKWPNMKPVKWMCKNIVKERLFSAVKRQGYVSFGCIQALNLLSFNFCLYYMWTSLSLIPEGQNCIMCGSYLVISNKCYCGDKNKYH